MFQYEDQEDKYGVMHRAYRLTQGDSCSIISTPLNDEGETVDPSLISQVKFKLYKNDNTRECIFEKVMPLYQTNKYLFKLNSDENTFALGKYKYEIEYTFVNEHDVHTTNQWYFEITEQAVS